jgi:hypothetical protein
VGDYVQKSKVGIISNEKIGDPLKSSFGADRKKALILFRFLPKKRNVRILRFVLFQSFGYTCFIPQGGTNATNHIHYFFAGNFHFFSGDQPRSE